MRSIMTREQERRRAGEEKHALDNPLLEAPRAELWQARRRVGQPSRRAPESPGWSWTASIAMIRGKSKRSIRAGDTDS
jgi:hypothetical protein